MANHRVGGEVDAACTRCKLTLAHTILAMVGTKIARVRCNTCMGEHAYRVQAGPAAPRTRAAASREPKASKVVVSFQERIAEKDASTAVDYSPKKTFAVDQLVRHPTFGLGIVSAVRPDKVEVAFKADVKTLVHGRGEGAAAKPAFQPPSARSDAPADKPMADQAGETSPRSPEPGGT